MHKLQGTACLLDKRSFALTRSFFGPKKEKFKMLAGSKHFKLGSKHFKLGFLS
jgi:hypothetical protein